CSPLLFHGFLAPYMRILFVHQNFPAQFKYVAPALVAKGHQVVALRAKTDTGFAVPDTIALHKYERVTPVGSYKHPWFKELTAKLHRAEDCFTYALKLKQEGFEPDVIVAHPGWGESLFLKQLWPHARLGLYLEFFYRSEGSDFGFDPEFPKAQLEHSHVGLRLKNLPFLAHLDEADAFITPTQWQAQQFPEVFQSKLSVIHDGIPTDTLRPNPKATLTLKTQVGQHVTLTREDEVITFVNRNLEPARGYHTFMRALPALLEAHPKARVILIGGSGVSYSHAPPEGTTWRSVYQEEIASKMPEEAWERVHFLGQIPYPAFVNVLQLSTVHVYLTYPFVLSWSLLEAMSLSCAIVASATPPVQEVIQHEHTGLLTDFFDTHALVAHITRLLHDPALRATLGQQARTYVKTHYDLNTLCLPQQCQWIESLGAVSV
ncbi:MAG: glycosyltransferase, partial [Vampirovibrionales bacterium]